MTTPETPPENTSENTSEAIDADLATWFTKAPFADPVARLAALETDAPATTVEVAAATLRKLRRSVVRARCPVSLMI